MDKLNQHNYCVIGDPIGHSLSPEIHTFVFQNMGLKLHYDKVHVRAEQLESFIRDSIHSDRPGFNITIPHKETIMKYLDDIDELASGIGAVNTVVNQGGRLIGYNTDVSGCRKALERNGWKTGNKVVMIGAGGAARAVIQALHLMNIPHIVVYDIIEDRCRRLKKDFSIHSEFKITIGSLNVVDIKNQLADADLLINATPVGMWPNVDQTPLTDISWLSSTATVFDLVPKPTQTRLLNDANTIGLKTIPGLVMLIALALAADEIWLQKKLPDSLFNRLWKHIHQIMDKS